MKNDRPTSLIKKSCSLFFLLVSFSIFTIGCSQGKNRFDLAYLESCIENQNTEGIKRALPALMKLKNISNFTEFYKIYPWELTDSNGENIVFWCMGISNEYITSILCSRPELLLVKNNNDEFAHQAASTKVNKQDLDKQQITYLEYYIKQIQSEIYKMEIDFFSYIEYFDRIGKNTDADMAKWASDQLKITPLYSTGSLWKYVEKTNPKEYFNLFERFGWFDDKENSNDKKFYQILSNGNDEDIRSFLTDQPFNPSYIWFAAWLESNECISPNVTDIILSLQEYSLAFVLNSGVFTKIVNDDPQYKITKNICYLPIPTLRDSISKKTVYSIIKRSGFFNEIPNGNRVKKDFLSVEALFSQSFFLATNTFQELLDIYEIEPELSIQMVTNSWCPMYAHGGGPMGPVTTKLYEKLLDSKYLQLLSVILDNNLLSVNALSEDVYANTKTIDDKIIKLLLDKGMDPNSIQR